MSVDEVEVRPISQLETFVGWAVLCHRCGLGSDPIFPTNAWAEADRVRLAHAVGHTTSVSPLPTSAPGGGT